jgi:hypothetical protein
MAIFWKVCPCDLLMAEGVKGAAWPAPSAVPLVLLLLLFFLFVVV